jgi:hypothetical protein
MKDLNECDLLEMIGRLMLERDHARRAACYARVDGGDKMPISYEDYALSRGWDCFEGMTS